MAKAASAKIEAPVAGQAAVLERGALNKALSAIGGVIQSRNTIPILSNVLIEAAGDHVRLTGTDLDRSLTLTVPCPDGHGIDTGWSTTVNMARLGALVSSWADGSQVRMEPRDGQMMLACGRASARLPTLPRDDFPLMAVDSDVISTVSASGKDWAALFHRVAFAQSTEEARYYLNGVFAHVADGRLRLVATNGHVVAAVAGPDAPAGWPGEPGVAGDGAKCNIIIPRATVGLLMRLLPDVAGDVTLSLLAYGSAAAPPRLEVEWPGSLLRSKIVDGTFPDYRRVFPPAQDAPLRVARGDLDAAVASASAVASDKTLAVKIDASADMLRVSATSAHNGTSEVEVPAAYDGAATTGFNGKYLRDIIGGASTAADGTVCLHLQDDPKAPVLVTGDADDWRGVIMPMWL